MIELIPEGLTETAYFVIVTGNSAKYNLLNVAAGTYTLKVTKNGHKTYTATVTVSDGDVIHNVELERIPSDVLLGDINGDGEVSAKDSNILKQALAGLLEFEEGSYEHKAADIDGDGMITAKDSNLLKQIIAGLLII